MRMKTTATYLFLCAALLFSCTTDEAATREKSSDSNDRIDSLLAEMTIKEKVGQMTQLNLDVLCVGEVFNLTEPHTLQADKVQKAIVEYAVGSILNCGGHAYTREKWHEIIGGIQQVAVNETRMKIPVLYGIDAIHGANYTLGSTLFPQQLAQAATWNPALVKQAAEITAYEVRASGIPWNFSPVLDLGRDPRWSRFFETYGEDVLLAKTLGVACIQGYQGEVLNGTRSVAACMKHFLAYSMPRTGKDRTPVYLHERQIREYFLPTFQAAIESGAATVMINSGEINGIPVHADKAILTDLLRTELKFEGLAVTDWEDIIKLHTLHKVAPTLKDAVRMAIEAGIDMSMVPNDFEFSDLLLELVEEGSISEARLDESVRRILKLKFDLGLFDNPFPPSIEAYPDFNNADAIQAARNTANEAITLLSNNGILPLKKTAKVFITGPGADDVTAINGAWTRTWQGTDTTWNDASQRSILDALRAQHEGQITFYNPVSYLEDASISSTNDLTKVRNMAQQADVAILCLAETPSTEKVGDISSLNLPRAQQILAEELLATGVPVIVVMVFNRPRIISKFIDEADAAIMAYLPGDQGGPALVDILHGTVNPSGKLPFTYPRDEADLVWYDHKRTEQLDPKFGMNAFNPQWQFGHGMSYTTFEYSQLALISDTINLSDTLAVSFTVKNTGDRAGKDVAQAYCADRFADITPSVKRLRAYYKFELQAGESKQFTVKIPAQSLQYIGKSLTPTLENGWFDISIANLRDSIYVKTN